MERLCAHTLAASYHKEILHDVVSSWQPKLSDLVSSSIPKKQERNLVAPDQAQERQAQERNVQVLEAPDTQYQFQDQDKLKITWLHGSKITTCYGCKNKFRKTASDPVPPEPYDIVLCRKQIRAYTPKGTTGLRFTVKPENTYFHLKRACVQSDTCERIGAHNVVITKDDKRHLKQIHLIKLKQEFAVHAAFLKN